MSKWIVLFVALGLGLSSFSSAQVAPYPGARTDRAIILKTPIGPPSVNSVFQDPDFGSLMVRVTDQNSGPRPADLGGYYRTLASGEGNPWSVDTGKFYVVTQGGADLAFGFDPSSLRSWELLSPQGRGLLLPFRPGAFFSLVDSDLIYGVPFSSPLTISSYRFSTATQSAVIDTTTCGTQPALNPDAVSGDDLSVASGDTRYALSEGGLQVDQHMFVVVHDRSLGCRWYNTQTGEIGGRWGPVGMASSAPSFLIHHAYISRDGRYVRILASGQQAGTSGSGSTATDASQPSGEFVWNIGSLQVTPCMPYCAGYGAAGFSHYVNQSGYLDEMNILERAYGNLSQTAQLVTPLPSPSQFGIELHFSWNDANANDSAPVCGSSLRYDAYGQIDRPWDAEIICLETDGAASTIWRFAHNRASADDTNFNTQPLGNLSRNGRFFMFTSDWDGQVGVESDGTPRSDVWIVKLQ